MCTSGLQRLRGVERADAHRMRSFSTAAVFACDRDAATLAARKMRCDCAPLVGRDGDGLRWRVGEHRHAVGLDQRVEHERAAGLALAAQAMAAMYEHRRAFHPIAHVRPHAHPPSNVLAIAALLERKENLCRIGRGGQRRLVAVAAAAVDTCSCVGSSSCGTPRPFPSRWRMISSARSRRAGAATRGGWANGSPTPTLSRTAACFRALVRACETYALAAQAWARPGRGG